MYTDGSSLGNPGPGGYGIVLKFGNKRKELSKGFFKTTNNRMELLAVIDALKSLKRRDLDILIHSDSSYVINAVVQGWLFDWERKGFKKTKNTDLWKDFLKLYKTYKIEFNWVKAHVGIAENERCDQLAKEAAECPTERDLIYESKNPN
ncbi:MAG: ribonuclease HI [Bacteroidetes bacterium]|nr:ribonuclease HI [Bacteroidota bacterium]MBL6963070.1 ribonuclease HI [Bacteroidota bacterium]